MKILILSFYFQPDLCAGSFRCTALVNELMKKLPPNATVDVISTLPNRYKSFAADAPAHEQKDNLQIHRIALPTHKSGMIDQTKAFFHFYRGALSLTKGKDYDLVLATSSRLFTAFLGARVARKVKAPLYLDIRDIFVDTLQDVLSPALAKLVLPVLKQVEKYTFSKVDRLNLVSEGFHSYFHQRYPRLDYRFFTNGIDDEFLQVEHSVKPPSENSSELKTIFYAGNIGEGQGIDRIIPGMAKALTGQYNIRVVGDGGRKPRLEEALAKAKVANVELLPPVSRAELIEYYKQADILFLHLNDYPAFEKVLPSKIFEYAALGKPILAGVAGYSAQFLHEEVTNSAVFHPGNVEQSVKKLEELTVEDRSRPEFIQKFTRTAIMTKMVDDILSVVKEKQ